MDLNDKRLAASAARLGAVAQRSHRPQERRAAPDRATVNNRVLNRTAALEIRDSSSSSTAHFTGVASTYEQPYEMWDFWGPYFEVVSMGAGAKSLAANPDVVLNLGHDNMKTIARTKNGSLNLSESTRGLEVDAPALNLEDADVATVVTKIRDGLFDQMSFAFRIIRGGWSPDYTEYRIDEYDIDRGDVAILPFGANPYTSTDLRSALKPGRELVLDEWTRQMPLVSARGRNK